MRTQILTPNETDIAARLLRKGKLVAIPTETVYGLAASALDEKAVKKIFLAKGRPQDNPLIIHIARKEDLQALVIKVPEKARILIENFWPGPLTIIFEKNNLIPDIVTAGSNCVAIRMPSLAVAREIISKSDVPLAAPSANLSGSPSPTSAGHVLQDLNGRIEAVLDAGSCSVGIESSIIDLSGEFPLLLRPGFVTPEEIEGLIGKINIDSSINSCIPSGAEVKSPGMKYKHYSPKTKVVIFNGSQKEYVSFLNSHGPNCAALCFNEDLPFLKVPSIAFGSLNNSKEQSEKLFHSLRKLDTLGVEIAYSRMPDRSGIGLAVLNRLLRSSNFEVIENVKT
ncbi:MAG: threonylcarbamoyl-AMP synthase [Oscillospiraceae bacterium]|jgi:L-threonylcarbamoyladenylate synthase|nr:threonylcarbamoyl-AMP synthase [Oscillospiraceae bacterium]